MNKGIIKTVILDQQAVFAEKLKREHLIPRVGSQTCNKYLSHPHVLLISGLRRVGKSVFSKLLAHNKNCPSLNFDDERLLGLTTADLNLVLECFYELYPTFGSILLDEIQNVPGWELFVNRLREQFRVIVTGSNAHLLSSEMATHLTGRFNAYNLFPLTFREFVSFHDPSFPQEQDMTTRNRSRLVSHFQDYLNKGGLFDYYKFGPDFLQSLYSSIVHRDIIARYRIRYPVHLQNLAQLLLNSFSSKCSPTRLAKHLGVKSPNTIRQYIQFLENSFLIFGLHKFSYKLKEQQSSFKKTYAIDVGLAHTLDVDTVPHQGRYLENLVAIELKRRCSLENGLLYYWDNYHKECDFVVMKKGKITSALQVCWELNAHSEEREFSGLVAALKEFGLKSGTILTQSSEDIIKQQGHTIHIQPVWKWMW